MSEALLDFVLGALRNAAAELSGVVLVLALIFVPLAGILYVVIRSLASQGGTSVRFEWKPGPDPQPDGPEAAPVKTTTVAANAAASASPFDQTRQFLANAYRVMMLLAGAGLLIAAVVAFLNATPGNGLLLVALLLFGLSLVVFGAAGKYKRPEREEDFLRSALDDLRSKLTVSTVSAPPEVHALNEAEFARARDMWRRGAAFDEIARAVNDQYRTWSPARQQAFRQLLQAALQSRTAA